MNILNWKFDNGCWVGDFYDLDLYFKIVKRKNVDWYVYLCDCCGNEILIEEVFGSLNWAKNRCFKIAKSICGLE